MRWQWIRVSRSKSVAPNVVYGLTNLCILTQLKDDKGKSMKSVFHSGPAHLSINNNILKPAITKLRFTVAQEYFKPSWMQTKRSPVSCSPVLYHSSYLHSAFPAPERHHSCSASPQASPQAHSNHANSWNHHIC